QFVQTTLIFLIFEFGIRGTAIQLILAQGRSDFSKSDRIVIICYGLKMLSSGGVYLAPALVVKAFRRPVENQRVEAINGSVVVLFHEIHQAQHEQWLCMVLVEAGCIRETILGKAVHLLSIISLSPPEHRF